MISRKWTGFVYELRKLSFGLYFILHNNWVFLEYHLLSIRTCFTLHRIPQTVIEHFVRNFGNTNSKDRQYSRKCCAIDIWEVCVYLWVSVRVCVCVGVVTRQQSVYNCASCAGSLETNAGAIGNMQKSTRLLQVPQVLPATEQTAICAANFLFLLFPTCSFAKKY